MYLQNIYRPPLLDKQRAALLVANPISIFKEDLLFWFDNSYGLSKTGSLIDSQTDRTGNATRSASGSARPTHNVGIEIEYDGVDDQLVLDPTTRDLVLALTECFVLVIADRVEQINNKYFLVADDGSTSDYVTTGIQGNGSSTAPSKQAIIKRASAGAENAVQGFTAPIQTGIQVFAFSTNGSRYKSYYDSEENELYGDDDGDWFADNVNIDAIRFGSVGATAFSNHKEYHILCINREPTADELSKLFVWASRPKNTNGLLNGLISAWELNESSGDAIDSHGGHNGTVSGATQGVSGKIGTAYSFITDDFISVPNPHVFTFGNKDYDTPFTIEAWVKMTDATQFPIISTYMDNSPINTAWELKFDGSDKLRLLQMDNGVANVNRKDVVTDNAQTALEGSFAHIVVISDGSVPSVNGVRIYINNVLVALSLGVDGASYVAKGDQHPILTIGASGRDSAAPLFANGVIDSIRIWNKTLTKEKVALLYNSNNGLAYSQFEN